MIHKQGTSFAKQKEIKGKGKWLLLKEFKHAIFFEKI